MKLVKSKGFTLVEILLVVGFIALASIGIYAVYNKVSTTGKANETVRQISTLKSEIDLLFASSLSYAGLNTQVLINGKIASPDMIDGSNLSNKFGGPIRITVYGAGNGYILKYLNIPADACSKIGSALSSRFSVNVGGPDGWVGSVNLSNIYNAPYKTLNPVLLAVECGKDVGDGVAMSFTTINK